MNNKQPAGSAKTTSKMLSFNRYSRGTLVSRRLPSLKRQLFNGEIRKRNQYFEVYFRKDIDITGEPPKPLSL